MKWDPSTLPWVRHHQRSPHPRRPRIAPVAKPERKEKQITAIKEMKSKRQPLSWLQPMLMRQWSISQLWRTICSTAVTRKRTFLNSAERQEEKRKITNRFFYRYLRNLTCITECKRRVALRLERSKNEFYWPQDFRNATPRICKYTRIQWLQTLLLSTYLQTSGLENGSWETSTMETDPNHLSSSATQALVGNKNQLFHQKISVI